VPTVILERVNELTADSIRHPADRTNRAHVRRQQRTPPAIAVGRRIPTANAPRVRQGRQPGPAGAARQVSRVPGKTCVTRDATAREQELGERVGQPPDGSGVRRPAPRA
jgi:hypothetical protein